MLLALILFLLASIIILALFNHKLHIGILGLTLAWILSHFFQELHVPAIENLLPSRLLINIAGISLLFLLADQNGSLGQLSISIQSLAQGRRHLLGVMVFLSIAVLSAFGAGNIGSTAIAAAPAMRIARDAKLPPFLMTLIVVGGANSTALSPFSVTGLLNRSLLEKQNIQNIDLLSWQVFFICFISISFVHLLGFYFLGGWAWAKQNTFDHEIEPAKIKWTSRQLYTLGLLAFFVFLLLLAGQFQWVAIQNNIGMLALAFASIIMILGLADVRTGIRLIPWDTIILIGGMFALIGMMEKAGYIKAVEGLLAFTTNPWMIATSLALAASVLSAFTSSSGVVMPLFIPMISTIILLEPTLSVLGTVSLVLVAAHMVDSSPFSSLGALCLGSISDHDEAIRRKTFNHLLYWGLAMIPVSVVIACLIYVFDT